MLIYLTATRAILNAKSPIFRSCAALPGESAIVNTLSQLSPFPNSQDSLGYLLSSVSRGRIEIARRVDRACLKRYIIFSSPSQVALSSESVFLFLIYAISWIQADRRNCSSGVMLIFFPDVLSLFYLLAAYLHTSGWVQPNRRVNEVNS